MATYYWGSATANWATANWATTSGGSYTVGPPTSADDVIFDLNSTGTCTIATTASCKSLYMSGAAGTLAGSSALTITGKNATNDSLLLGGTFTHSGTITFSDTSGTVNKITMGGKSSGSMTFNGVGGNWQFQDTVNNPTQTLTLTNGSVDTNNQSVAFATFTSSNSNTRSLTLGTTTWTNIGAWTISGSGITVSAASSTLTFAPSAGLTFTGGGFTYGTINWTPTNTNIILVIAGSNTFSNVNLTWTSTTGPCGFRITSGTTQTVTGTFTSTGNVTSSHRGLIYGAATLSAATASISYTDFQGITLAGTATWSGTSIGDVGGNTNLTPTASVTRYWVATSGGNWSATTSWASSSGGASGATVPLPQDDVIIDSNSITSLSATITCDVNIAGRNINFTGVLNAPTLTGAGGTVLNVLLLSGIGVTGDLTLGAGMTSIQNSWQVQGNFTGVAALTGATTALIYMLTVGNGSGVTKTITMGSTSTALGFYILKTGDTVQLQDNLITTGPLTLSAGTLDFNLKAVSVFSWNLSSANVRTFINSPSTITLIGTGTVFDFSTATNFGSTTWPTTIDHNNSSATACTWSGSGSSIILIPATTTIKRSAGSGSLSISNRFGSIDLTGWTGTTLTNSTTLIGDFKGSSTITSASSLIVNFNPSTGTTCNVDIVTTALNTLSIVVSSTATGTVKLAATNNSWHNLTVNAGTFDANGFSLTMLGITVAAGATVNFGSGTWTFNVSGGSFMSINPAATILATACSIVVVGTTASAKSMSGGGQTYNSISFGGTGTGAFTISDGNTFTTLSITSPPQTLTLTSGTITTIGSLNISGTDATHRNTLNASTSGSFASIVGNAGNFSEDWIVLQDNHLSGVTGAYGFNSIYSTGNAGWASAIQSVNTFVSTGTRFASGVAIFKSILKIVGVTSSSTISFINFISKTLASISTVSTANIAKVVSKILGSINLTSTVLIYFGWFKTISAVLSTTTLKLPSTVHKIVSPILSTTINFLKNITRLIAISPATTTSWLKGMSLVKTISSTTSTLWINHVQKNIGPAVTTTLGVIFNVQRLKSISTNLTTTLNVVKGVQKLISISTTTLTSFFKFIYHNVFVTTVSSLANIIKLIPRKIQANSLSAVFVISLRNVLMNVIVTATSTSTIVKKAGKFINATGTTLVNSVVHSARVVLINITSTSLTTIIKESLKITNTFLTTNSVFQKLTNKFVSGILSSLSDIRAGRLRIQIISTSITTTVTIIGSAILSKVYKIIVSMFSGHLTTSTSTSSTNTTSASNRTTIGTEITSMSVNIETGRTSTDINTE